MNTLDSIFSEIMKIKSRYPAPKKINVYVSSRVYFKIRNEYNMLNVDYTDLNKESIFGCDLYLVKNERHPSYVVASVEN